MPQEKGLGRVPERSCGWEGGGEPEDEAILLSVHDRASRSQIKTQREFIDLLNEGGWGPNYDMNRNNSTLLYRAVRVNLKTNL